MDGKDSKVKLKKVFCLDENYKFPECHECGKELTPFSINSIDLNKVTTEVLNTLIKFNYLRINGVAQDKHLLFVCKNCCSVHLTKNKEKK